MTKLTPPDTASVTVSPAIVLTGTAAAPFSYDHANRAVAAVPPSSTSTRNNPSGTVPRGSPGGLHGSVPLGAAVRSMVSLPVESRTRLAAVIAASQLVWVVGTARTRQPTRVRAHESTGLSA